MLKEIQLVDNKALTTWDKIKDSEILKQNHSYVIYELHKCND